MKPLCVLGIALHPDARTALEARYDVTGDLERIDEAAAAAVYGVPDDWAARECPKLKIIGCHSHSAAIGAWARARGIRVVLADGLWRTVAEHTLALMLSAARRVPQADAAMRAGLWRDHETLKARFSGLDLQGRTLGILGLGQIGRELAEMVAGFRMRVLYHDLRRQEDAERRLGVEYMSFDALLASSDYLCVLVPLNEETRGLLGPAEFAGMKRGCVLVNTARAGIVNPGALIAALDDGSVSAAGLDVFWKEAQDPPAALMENPRVVMTPHLGGSTFDCDMSLIRPIVESQDWQAT